MNERIRALLQEKGRAVDSARHLLDVADHDNHRALTEAEEAGYSALEAKIADLSKRIEREHALAEHERGAVALDIGEARITGGTPRLLDDPKLGFASFGEYAAAVQKASVPGSRVMDERLSIVAAAPSTYGGEGVGQDGGFLVPPEYSKEIFNLSLMDDALLPLTDNVTIGGNSMVFPKDETTPWGTDGVRAYWQSESTAGTQTKPKFGTATLRLHKLLSLVPITDELLGDASALNSYLPPLMGRSIRWKTNESILFGAGNGTPLGALQGAAALTVAKESGQAANTVDPKNLFKMVAALPPGSFPNAVWMMGPDVLPAVFGLSLGNYPIYLPMEGTGIQGSPYGTLLGRPIMVSQHSAAFSSAGDILLLDLSYYRSITQAGGIQTASSMHLYFDADATAFRATFRVDGQPKIAAQISQAKGSNKLSPFVQLGAR